MKKVFAMVLLAVVVLGLFTGCTKELVTITEKEVTSWTVLVVVNNTTQNLVQSGWNYKGVNSNGEEITWRSVESHEIGETVEVLH